MQSAIDQNYMFELFVGELPIARNSERDETKRNRFRQEWPSRWWFQTFFMFIPKIGEMIQFDSYFSNGLKPPTSPGFFGASVKLQQFGGQQLTFSWWMTFIGYIITVCVDWFVLALYAFWWKAKMKSSGLGFIIEIHSSILLLLMIGVDDWCAEICTPLKLTAGTQQLLV